MPNYWVLGLLRIGHAKRCTGNFRSSPGITLQGIRFFFEHSCDHPGMRFRLSNGAAQAKTQVRIVCSAAVFFRVVFECFACGFPSLFCGQQVVGQASNKANKKRSMTQTRPSQRELEQAKPIPTEAGTSRHEQARAMTSMSRHEQARAGTSKNKQVARAGRQAGRQARKQASRRSSTYSCMQAFYVYYWIITRTCS